MCRKDARGLGRWCASAPRGGAMTAARDRRRIGRQADDVRALFGTAAGESARSPPRPPAQAARVRGRADAGRPRRPAQGLRPRRCGARPGRRLRPAGRPDRPHRGRPPAPRPRALLSDRRPRRPDPDHHPQGALCPGVRGAGRDRAPRAVAAAPPRWRSTGALLAPRVAVAAGLCVVLLVVGCRFGRRGGPDSETQVAGPAADRRAVPGP